MHQRYSFFVLRYSRDFSRSRFSARSRSCSSGRLLRWYWIPHGGGDLVSFLWPQYSFAAKHARRMIPLWNPHLYSGAPFLADNQAGVLYPINLLAFRSCPTCRIVMEGLAIFHIWLAGAAMYVGLRVWPTLARPLPSGQPSRCYADMEGRGEIGRCLRCSVRLRSCLMMC